MTRRQRIIKRYRAEYNYGRRVAEQLHVSATNKTLIKACRGIINRAQWHSVDYRDARHALYLGAMKAHDANRKLYRRVMSGRL